MNSLVSRDGVLCVRSAWSVIGVLIFLAVAACSRSKSKEGPQHAGHRIAAGPARALQPSPDGNSLAYLDRCARPPLLDLPIDVVSCDLELISVTGGASQRIAEGVSSLGAQVAWSGDGRALAALAEYDYQAGRGKLVFVETGGEPSVLGDGVSFFGFAPGGSTLVYVARGQLMVKQRGETEPREVRGADSISTFEFNPAPSSPASPEVPALILAARRAAAAGGDLLGVARWESPASRLAPQVSDYRFTPHGWLAFTMRGHGGNTLVVIPTALTHGDGASWTLAAVSPLVGANVQRFSFSPTSGAMAFLANVTPGKVGDLLAVGPGAKGQPELLAKSVGEYRWAAATQRLAWLQDFDAQVRSGTLAVGGPGVRPVVLGRHVDSFDIDPEGTRLAYLEHGTAGGYSVDLKLADVRPDAQPQTVVRGAFGFAFSPDGNQLYYRTNCVRNAEACDLYVTRGAPDEKARRLAEGIKSFEFDRRRPGWLLVTWSRKDLVAMDLAVLQPDGKLTAVDQAALPGSAQFLGPDSRRLGYIVADPKRAGVYVAQVP